MGTLDLRTALLSTLIAVSSSSMAAMAQQDDRSYLPPPSFQTKADPAHVRGDGVPHRNGSEQVQRARPRARAIRAYPRYHRSHYAYFPRFFSGFLGMP